MSDLESKLKELVFAAHRAFTEKTRPELKEASKKILLDPESPVLALLISCRHVLGPDFFEWEPETIWLSLEGALGGDHLPLLNRDKILAGTTLYTVPAFYWDYRVFGNTCLAFNGHKAFAELVPEPLPEHAAWAAFECELVFVLHDEGKTHPDYDDEIAAYVAAILVHNGFVTCPEMLKFAEPHLNKLLMPHAKEMATKVRAASSAEGFSEDELGVQQSRLRGVELYVLDRADNLLKALSKF